MDKKFYSIGADSKRSALKIQSRIKYDTLDVLRKDSPLIIHPDFCIKQGKKLFDVIQFNDSSNFAISRKVKELLEQNNVTGWGCFKIRIEGISDDYFAFQTLSKAGPILNPEQLMSYATEFIEFDIATWDGSDIFNLDETLLTACTPRVKEILEVGEISNLQIMPL